MYVTCQCVAVFMRSSVCVICVSLNTLFCLSCDVCVGRLVIDRELHAISVQALNFTHIVTHSLTRTQSHIVHIHTHTKTHTCTHPHIHTVTHTHTHTHAHPHIVTSLTHTHTNTLTHIHTHSITLKPPLLTSSLPESGCEYFTVEK